MSHQFLHMGCDHEIARKALAQITGVREIKSGHAGLKLEADNGLAQIAYYDAYHTLERGKGPRPFLIAEGYRLWCEDCLHEYVVPYEQGLQCPKDSGHRVGEIENP